MIDDNSENDVTNDENTANKNEEENEEEKVIYEPPPPLTPELKHIIEEKFSEFAHLKTKEQELEQTKQKRIKRLAELKQKAKIELSWRTAEYTLKSLHKVAKNPDIIKYLDEIGNIIIFEADRGYGKNSIVFIKRNKSVIENAIQDLIKQKEVFKKSSKPKAETAINIEEIETSIEEKQEELEYIINAGGKIAVYVEKQNRAYEINFYSKNETVRIESLSMLRVYFGNNMTHKDLFHKFNTPELIMKLICQNIQKGGVEDEIVRLKDIIRQYDNNA